MAKSLDLDQTPRSAASDLGLHCISCLSVRIGWVEYGMKDQELDNRNFKNLAYKFSTKYCCCFFSSKTSHIYQGLEKEYATKLDSDSTIGACG